MLLPGETKNVSVLLGYGDVASINYFGVPTKAWYARGGKTIVDALAEFDATHDALLYSCSQLDNSLLKEAMAKGYENYALIVTAAYRQC